MGHVIVIANITVQEGAQEDILPAFARLIKATRNEAGCIRYDLHQYNFDATKFCFYEIWETKGNLDDHSVSPHVKAFQSETATMIKSAVLSELTALDLV